MRRQTLAAALRFASPGQAGADFSAFSGFSGAVIVTVGEVTVGGEGVAVVEEDVPASLTM